MKDRTLHYKLVRDRIPEIIEEAGKTHQTTILEGEALKDAAFRKLQEEVMEFVENPCAEEAESSSDEAPAAPAADAKADA